MLRLVQRCAVLMVLAVGGFVGLTSTEARAAGPHAGPVLAEPLASAMPARVQPVQYYYGPRPYPYRGRYYARPYYRPYPRFYARHGYGPRFYGRPYHHHGYYR